MKRLFVAVPVSEEVKNNIKPVVNELSKLGAGLKLVSVSQLHFTLKFLGEVDEKEILQIEKKLTRVAEKTTEFNVPLKGIGVFPSVDRINVVWIGTDNQELVSLMKNVNEELSYIRKNEFDEEVAHLTIARVKTARNKERLLEFVKNFEKRVFGVMRVNRLILYESELTREGPIYSIVREFELR